MVRLLKDIVVKEIYSVDEAANPGARVLLAKRDQSKGDNEMSDELVKRSTIYKSAENCLKYGTPPTFSRADYHTAITKRAADLKRAGESDAKAFTRTITNDEIGRTLYKASKFAKGPEIEGDATQDMAGPAAPNPSILGPAHAEMEALAQDHFKANPRKTIEGARGFVYADPHNAELREKCKAEHLASMMQDEFQ